MVKYWRVSLTVFSHDRVHNFTFTSEHAHGSEFGVSDANDAINEAFDDAERNNLKVQAVESVELRQTSFD